MEEGPIEGGDEPDGEGAGGVIKRMNRDPRLLRLAKRARELLPGDSEFGDSLSIAGREQSQLVGRQLADATRGSPGFLGEAGLTALQVWQALSEAQGRGAGEEELAIAFTDLVDFSSWALSAGDEEAVRLLRAVDAVMDPAIRRHGGEIVKRLGDGMMAVFPAATGAVDALLEAREEMAAVEVAGHRPRFRAGLHVGKPRKLGGDYLGVDVNIAARVAEQASADELLVSDAALAELEGMPLKTRKKRGFSLRVKGVPKDMTAYSVSPAR